MMPGARSPGLWMDGSAMMRNWPTVSGSVSTLLADNLAAELPARRRATLERDLDFALRTAVAVLQQELLYAPVSPSRSTYADDDLTVRLTALLRAAYQRSGGA
jgi:hypothetical protein